MSIPWVKSGVKDIMDFGKHYGKYVSWVCDNDPQYILWASENVTDFNPTSEVLQRARRNID